MRQCYSRIRNRGEKFLYKVQKRKENEKECALDDSELYKTGMLANGISDRGEDLRLIQKARKTEGLTDIE